MATKDAATAATQEQDNNMDMNKYEKNATCIEHARSETTVTNRAKGYHRPTRQGKDNRCSARRQSEQMGLVVHWHCNVDHELGWPRVKENVAEGKSSRWPKVKNQVNP